jgi:hypothetical protein
MPGLWSGYLRVIAVRFGANHSLCFILFLCKVWIVINPCLLRLSRGPSEISEIRVLWHTGHTTPLVCSDGTQVSLTMPLPFLARRSFFWVPFEAGAVYILNAESRRQVDQSLPMSGSESQLCCLFWNWRFCCGWILSHKRCHSPWHL